MALVQTQFRGFAGIVKSALQNRNARPSLGRIAQMATRSPVPAKPLVRSSPWSAFLANRNGSGLSGFNNWGTDDEIG